MIFKALTALEIQKLDKIAIQKIGIPSIALMENAGRAAAQEVLRRSKKFPQKPVLIFCGLGNNAGDGFVCARHLINHNIRTKIFLIGNLNHLKNDAAINYKILRNLKIPIHVIQSSASLKTIDMDLKKSKIIVDAIFGVGLNRDIEGLLKTVIEKINSAKATVISVDVPSGLDATTGKIHGVCVRATTTVTFSFAKKGFYLREGPRQVGRIVVVDIGIPTAVLPL
ncbi:MAG TPA: NAD(P)H-hydrate epimerase [Candidatus Omnitrophota bacterium]|nr:NAD(P)H-hydrate epimerase [Candidatus Omnitrophota bacterium]